MFFLFHVNFNLLIYFIFTALRTDLYKHYTNVLLLLLLLSKAFWESHSRHKIAVVCMWLFLKWGNCVNILSYTVSLSCPLSLVACIYCVISSKLRKSNSL